MKLFSNFILTALLSYGIITVNSVALSQESESDLTHIIVGRMIDVIDERVLHNQVITVKNERIVDVKPIKKGAAYSNAIDWSAYTVLPGLIDGHTHLIGDIQSNDVLAPINATAEEDLALGKINAYKTLKAGFTSVIDVGSYRAFRDVALRNEIDNGNVLGPRMRVAGAYVTVTGGGGEVVGKDLGVDIPNEFRRGVADDEQQVRMRVRDLIEGGADLIKVIATGAVLTVGTEPGQPEFTEIEIRAAVEEARKFGKYVTAHAHGAEGIKMAIRSRRSVNSTWFIDGRRRHCLNDR